MFRRRRSPDDFAREVRAHLEHEEAELRAAGMSPGDARAEARRRFGNPTRAIERVYETRPLHTLETLWQDVRYAARLMRRSPSFSITAALVLSLGIGVNTALFSIVNSLFFRPLPVKAPEELFYLYQKNESGQVMAFLDHETFKFFTDRAPDLADYTGHAQIGVRLTADDETERASGEMVKGNYFEFLGVPMTLGRPLGGREDDPANPETAIVISHAFWLRRFKGDAGIIGRKIRLDNVHVTIVGVAAEGFDGLSDPWTPTQFWASGVQMYAARMGRAYPDFIGGPIGRLRPGVTIEQVKAFFATVVPEWKQLRVDRLRTSVDAARFDSLRRSTMAIQFPIYRAVDTTMPFSPERKLIPTSMLAGMVTVVSLVLLIATANIAGLLLARGVTRTGEVAVRRALGAGGARVTRQLLTESVLLACAGGAIGLAVATLLVGLFRAYTPSRFAVDVGVDVRVLLFAIAVCLGAGVLVGLAPALQAARVNVLEALGSGIVGARVVRARLRHWIVVPQVALSLVLLLVAAVHVRSLLRVESNDLGYRTDDAVVFSLGVWMPEPTFQERMKQTREERQLADEKTAAHLRTFYGSVLDRVGAVPQVDAVGITDSSSLPVYSRADSTLRSVITRDGYATGEPSRAAAAYTIVSDGYFDAMRMRLLRGRLFDARDGSYEMFRPRVAVISEALARTLWPAGQAIGQSLAFLPEGSSRIQWLEVIGVVNEVDPVLNDVGQQPRVYVSLAQQWGPSSLANLIVRGRGDQAALIRDVKAAAVGADAFAEVWQVRTMEQIVAEILYPRRLAAAILAAAGLIGLVLASVGLYGVVSYSVAQRLREIGIRATLGADRRDIVGLILREGVRVTALGAGAGAVLAALALRWSASLVPDVPAVDPLSFAAVPAMLGLVVAAACAVPALRASRVDPARVLRGE